jgi:uncharacterized membrane protein YvbJ
MSETLIEKIVCQECGAEVRENTLFCYSCGARVTSDESVADAHTTADTNGTEKADMSDDTRNALDELAQKLDQDEAENADRLAVAAAERKKARVTPRKKKEFVWEPVDEAPGLLFVLITLLIVFVVAGIVFLTVYWK